MALSAVQIAGWPERSGVRARTTADALNRDAADAA